MPVLYEITGDMGIKLVDVKEGVYSLESFIKQLTQKDLETIVRGEGMSSPKVTSGTAGAFGGVGDNLLKFGIPAAIPTMITCFTRNVRIRSLATIAEPEFPIFGH